MIKKKEKSFIEIFHRTLGMQNQNPQNKTLKINIPHEEEEIEELKEMMKK